MRNKVAFIPLIIFFIIILAVFYTKSRDLAHPVSNNSVAPTTPKSTISTPKIYSGYKADWIIIDDPAKINLYSNLDRKESSWVLFENQKCKYLVSSGFYTKEDNHIGLYVSAGKTISQAISDDLFNGYFYINGSVPTISSSYLDGADLALQSGPIILLNNSFTKLNIVNDENARRILVGLTEDNDIVFIVIYSENKILGPKMTEIKDVISQIEAESDIDFRSILNLDGGSHSAFLTESLTIPEVSTIGGYFCIEH